jgi:hypothetical protein
VVGVPLQGQNEVMGMGDTGLDVGHCFFRDSNVSFSGFQSESGASNFAGGPLQYFDSTTHRKIRQMLGVSSSCGKRGGGASSLAPPTLGAAPKVLAFGVFA